MNLALDVTTAVNPALQALLAGTVDYAGLFPPAGLPLAEALANHASYLGKDGAWMLGRFVLPTPKMAEAAPLVAKQFGPEHILRVSALGVKAETPLTFLANLETSLQELTHFQAAHESSVLVDLIEAPLPPLSSGGTEMRPLLRQAVGILNDHAPESLAVFCEIPFSETLPAIMVEVAAFNAESPRHFAVKLRTGGLAAAAFPTTGQLADALAAARDNNVALKFTAGLHHPIRRFDPGVQSHMHGFLNVLVAGIFAREHGLGAVETRAILDDENAENFRFTDAGFAWRDLVISAAAIATHRRYITSFGSCSFDEPRDDLRQLGLLA